MRALLPHPPVGTQLIFWHYCACWKQAGRICSFKLLNLWKTQARGSVFEVIFPLGGKIQVIRKNSGGRAIMIMFCQCSCSSWCSIIWIVELVETPSRASISTGACFVWQTGQWQDRGLKAPRSWDFPIHQRVPWCGSLKVVFILFFSFTFLSLNCLFF